MSAPLSNPTTLLELQRVAVHFPVRRGLLRRQVGEVRAVDEVSLHVATGETLGLVGESGCGKTTLAQAVMRLTRATGGEAWFRAAEGPVELFGLAPAALRALRPQIQYVFQNPDLAMNPRMTAMQIVAEPLQLNLRLTRAELERRVDELLEAVGLARAVKLRPPSAFSGGQRQRLVIARALALSPRLVIADEPVSALDVSVQAQILNLLNELKQRFALTFLFIAHNLGVVRYMSDRIAVMYLGRIVELGATDLLCARPLHPYTQLLLAAIPATHPDLAMQHPSQRLAALPASGARAAAPNEPPSGAVAGCPFHPRCTHVQARCRSERPELLARPDGTAVACHFSDEIQASRTASESATATLASEPPPASTGAAQAPNGKQAAKIVPLVLLLLSLLLVGAGRAQAQAPVMDIATTGTTDTTRTMKATPAPGDAERALRESPSLAARVKAGELPPLEQRLPEHPLQVPVVEGLGVYGGTWRTYHIGVDMVSWRLINNYTPLVRWSPDLSRLEPGLAERWEYSTDGRTITFHLRKGLRWSDGAPFTSADIGYWWKLCNDERVIYRPPEWAFAGGQKMQVQTPDAWTVSFTYSQPFYFVPNFMATGFWVPEQMLLPRHYLEKFDPDVTKAYADFNELVRKNNVYDNPERPTLSPWRLSYVAPTGDRAVFERNPYYYGVDPAGRQLPYIDRVESLRVQNSEAGVLLIIGGNVDAQFRLISQMDYSLLKRFAEKAGYAVRRWEEGTAAWYSVCLNWSDPDPAKRAVLRDKRVRRALSVAIDRRRINQLVWRGLGRPQAGAITDEAWHFNSPRGQQVLERWRSAWAQHDPRLANRMLDEAGLAARDGEGFRTLPGGGRLEFVIDSPDDDNAINEAELVRDDFATVGVRAIVRRAVGAEMWTRVQVGKFDMYMQHNSEMDLFSFPAWVFPTANINWHPLEGRYYMTGGKEGLKPEGVMARLLEIYEACKREPDLEKRHQLVLDAIELHLQEGPFFLGTCGRQPSLVVVGDNFHNVPQKGILGPLAVSQPGSQYPEQFYMTPGGTASAALKEGRP